MNTLTDNELLHLGASANFPTDTPRRVDAGERRLCVVNHGNQLYAMDDLCTHGHAYLSDGEFVAEECAMECPLHGGLFNIKTGQACGAPATKPVRQYVTVVRDGEVYVQLA